MQKSSSRKQLTSGYCGERLQFLFFVFTLSFTHLTDEDNSDFQ